MSQKNKNFIYLLVSISIVVLIIGITLGIIIKSKTGLVIDEKIRYSELLNWATTIFIGVLIGYILRNKYENNKIVKTFLLDDLKQISTQIIILKDFCYNLKKCATLTEEQRKDIISKFNLLDKKITLFTDFLKECDNEKHKDINTILINSLNGYNRKLTSDGLYNDPMEPIYFDDIASESSKFESEVRKITLTIMREM